MPPIPDRVAARLAWTRQVLDDASLTLQPASADASFRSYWRTAHGGQSWIVMDSPPQREDPRPWLAIGARLAAAGLHVPAVQAHDLQQGFLLIEDLGSRLYLAELNGANADRLYGDAMDALLAMQTRMPSDDLPPFDHAVLVSGLEVMPEWFLQRHLGHAPACGEWDVLEAAFGVIVRNALAQPRRFVHRDFHSRNLLVVDENNPGIIDFQGALHGPLTYDLASLLRDAYIAWPRERVEGWVESYRRRLLGAGVIDASVDAAHFLRWFDLTGLHRHVRVLGQFYRLWYRDGKPGYLRDVPQVYRYVIEVAGSYPELADFAALLERHVQGRDLTQVAA
ncbi:MULTISPECIES: aminoglycoside phosphotransferase family protein [Rhodanobacter]|uniref:aminoglycoside phosphotransferase family protein n=1 Tax=Rhodanobacter TaxID=75309 RepID=UPI00048979B1|nr:MULTISPECIES: phosphotransferase [Rhodanobacter]KZC19126.1 aminoglycoside phosphotransferase [Rhodanobacter denitrificans]UJJ52122.1 phosphotransferase [Rhodanobacter denitrificans]UJM94868.1 phosphotransferase [Rhodanobacter denitrificans]UJM98398.1 phosphotransferase [Rhodanobacter denitrificans]UJN22189.1 phosphotransferase [Rhodanobacter denitrificans]